uniref:Uncharacterized protein n=1 Tax=Rhizophora mucronata TaxID=61149 RepID=A0A2P2NGB0_RHIMU
MALAIMPGNIISKPTGVGCFLSVAAQELASTNCRPRWTSLWPTSHFVRARTHARVEDRASLMSKGWEGSRDHDPSGC